MAAASEASAPAVSFLLPGIAARRQRRLPSGFLELASSPVATCPEVRRKPRCLTLKTPSSCASASCKAERTPCTPDPMRSDLRAIVGDVGAVLFDFDGTLTALPGGAGRPRRRQAELRERAPMLEPRLRALRDAGVVLGIVSKSSEFTIRCALSEAGLLELFDGPIVAKAVGFEGKAGFIEELVRTGSLSHLGPDGLPRVLLVDDDVRELERARVKGIQTYAAPADGGLQEEDFDEIFLGVGLDIMELEPVPSLHESEREPPGLELA